MKIKNTEYGFRLTVGASIRIAELCPNRDLSRISEAIEKNYGTKADLIMSRILLELNAGYAAAEAYEGRAAARLKLIDVLELQPVEFGAACDEAVQVFARDIDGEIEIVAKGKNNGSGGLIPSLPWFLYHGRCLGMSKAEIMITTVGEMSDMVACRMIEAGVAKEKKPKPTLEQIFF